jgi:hypothetical protein
MITKATGKRSLSDGLYSNWDVPAPASASGNDPEEGGPILPRWGRILGSIWKFDSAQHEILPSCSRYSLHVDVIQHKDSVEDDFIGEAEIKQKVNKL